MSIAGRALLLGAAALLAAACSSTSSAAAVKAAKSGDGLTVGESQFMRTGPIDDSAKVCDTPSRSAEAPQVLRPESPWIGTVGLTTSLSNSMRFGLGIEVPNPVDRRMPTAPLTDRLQDTGVGAWLSIDF